MIAGRRIRVIGGPWPERVGRLGHVMIPIPIERGLYPFRGLGKDEEVIRLDDDPLDCTSPAEGWTCVIARSDIELVNGGKAVEINDRSDHG